MATAKLYILIMSSDLGRIFSMILISFLSLSGWVQGDQTGKTSIFNFSIWLPWQIRSNGPLPMGAGGSNWKNLHFQLFHMTTLANLIKWTIAKGCRGIKLENPPFSTFPYDYLDKSDQMDHCQGVQGDQTGKTSIFDFSIWLPWRKKMWFPRESGVK